MASPRRLSPLRRLSARLDLRRRRKGFGVQSPFAYSFVRTVIFGGAKSELWTRLSAFACNDFDILALTPDTIPATEGILDQVSPRTLLYYEGIYRNRCSLATWRKLAANEQASYVFDCYSYGIIFFRPTLCRQSYRLRV